ncbi:ASCH domain-containing protein [Rhodonellum sp.]|uniref:ASCH domain-containing protein n=1 Tax=Rhodonellum sp. TaxID=2231180 RepID=UPI0027250A47|nr:ASCH domain-containing protein [Rhodonellum sp.]MDO9554552.1 ASCH domain-containing protein [Rhodonellum sp.]
MLLGFKPQFIEPIKSGSKVFTVRKKRRIRPKIGETLYMYTRLRTKDCQKISEKHTLKSIQMVDITIKSHGELHVLWIRVDGNLIDKDSHLDFIEKDGFQSKSEFMDYWIMGVKAAEDGWKELELKGLELFHWTDLKF